MVKPDEKIKANKSLIKKLYEYYKKRGYSDQEVSEKVQKLLAYLDDGLLDADMSIEETIDILTEVSPKKIKKRKFEMMEATSKEVFRWLEERQIDKSLVDEWPTEDAYDILFVILFDWYVILMLFWRKAKWTAR